MNDAAGTFVRRILVRQALVGLCAFGAMAMLAPTLLLLEWEVARGILGAGAVVAMVALAATTAMTSGRLLEHRAGLRSLSQNARALEPRLVVALGALPSRLTLRFLWATCLPTSLVLVPGIRPEGLDGGRAVSLAILAAMILAASAIPHYLIVRDATSRVFELSAPEAVASVLEDQEALGTPRARVQRKLLLAVALPVALVGAAAVLVTHAHLRTRMEDGRRVTARLVARAALERAPGVLGDAGRDDALRTAARYGFHAEVDHDALPPAVATFGREADGRIAGTFPLEDGVATVRFAADLGAEAVTSGILIAAVAVLVALALGRMVGRVLADDLAQATRRVRLLGTETVLRGTTMLGRAARFAVVSRLGRAIEVLAERFRVFAAAQERAIEARENAQRMRGLLFASVSHDLKSPLNAVLGFADLVATEELTGAQRESLTLIQRRGRELLALIETILDAARVEAGQLTLMPRAVSVRTLIDDAVRKAYDLVAEADDAVAVDVPGGMPPAWVDQAYATRAVAVLVAHALRAGARDKGSDPVRIVVSRPSEESDRARVAVEHGSRTVPPAELEALLLRQSTSRGKGLTLGLSLARSILVLHGGSVEVACTQEGATVAVCWIPLGIGRPTDSQPRS